MAETHHAGAVVIEDLDFVEQRTEGREHAKDRPSRGRRGKAFRRQISGLPTAQFRDRLTQMAYNAGVAVIAVGPAYTSLWGAQHWLAPLQPQYPRSCLTGHHAAAVAIGRRGLAQRARRRGTHARRSPGDGLRATVRSSAGGAIDGVSRSLGDHPTNRCPGPSTGRRRPPDGAIQCHLPVGWDHPVALVAGGTGGPGRPSAPGAGRCRRTARRRPVVR
jgi:IS605 OrfB family transposase